MKPCLQRPGSSVFMSTYRCSSSVPMLSFTFIHNLHKRMYIILLNLKKLISYKRKCKKVKMQQPQAEYN